MQKPFPLSKVKPNPFRHMDRYPIRREKVEALKQSLRRTGFWENIVAREVKGEAEIAYGHHRLVALQEELGPKAKVPLVIKDLDDEAMLQMMARENMDDWSTSATVEQETVRAVVEAYASGRIALPDVSKDTKKTVIRYAPSFIQGDDKAPGEGQSRPYTATLIAEFLGWPDQKVHSTMAALELIEQEIVQEDQFQGLSTKQAEALTTETKKTKRAYDNAAKEKPAPKDKQKTAERGKQEAARVAEHVAEKLKSGEIGYKEVAEEAQKVRGKKPAKAGGDVDELARELASHLESLLSRGDPSKEQMDRILAQQKRLGAAAKKALRLALDKLSDRCLHLHDALDVD